MHNIYLEIDGVKGQSTSDQGKDQIEVLSFSHSVSMPLSYGSPSGGSRTTGRAQLGEMSVTKFTDLATPLLYGKVCGGDSIKTVKLHVFQADSEAGKPLEFLTYELSNVVISSLSLSGGSDGRPIESLSLSYTKISCKYQQQKSEHGVAGSTPFSWDVAANKKP